ncbi:type II secretion system inner membrane protein GspF [Sphaerotilus montanus]|uniref:General secretion pathway protein F n=1 Tax=Sphaerotilus montanus TaxID=522889 RepID=A0A7Y9U5K0_9BURK|nr:type II secretion system inner membrane protein GspF [Sphaerotilus montanus]NYG31677.1 general secretion pathway protein F [Sphaerotilus montanus]NZD58206.1 type II secretion system inner membrane protein GspF [Sphaerotilus montanus]
MPAYRFEALDAAGKTQTGLLDGDNAKAVRSQLRARALVPLDVQLVESEATATAAAGGSMMRRRVFSATTLAIWTRQLAGLVGAGLPLERALTALADEAEDPRQRELLAHLRAEVNGGSPFASALGNAPREFDDVYRAVVAAGEQSGQLGRVLEKLADDLEERQALKSRLVGATLYPAIVSVVAIVIVVFLVTYVVPQVAQVFAGSKKALPFLTSAMLALSAFLRHWGWALLLALIGAGALLVMARRNEATRERLDAMVLTLPIVGRLARSYNAARFAGTLAMLAGSGVPILKALQAAAETLSNRAMRADALAALVQVREGAPLASALSSKKRFPGLLSMFARLGEQTGELPVMLQRAATQLGAEVQRRAMQMATILEPMLIVVMGAMVMVIVLAVLLPIIQLNTFVK